MRFLTSRIAFAVALIAIVSPAYSLDVYSSAAGNYSVNFPSPPEEHIQEDGKDHVVTHIVRYDNAIYVVSHCGYVDVPNAEIEMDASINNYVKEISSHVVSRSPIKIMREDKLLRGKQFSFNGDRLVGRGVVVLDGKTSYMIAAGGIKPASREAEVSAFLGSFKLLPNAR